MTRGDKAALATLRRELQDPCRTPDSIREAVRQAQRRLLDDGRVVRLSVITDALLRR